MTVEGFILRRVIVLGSGLVYWAGVWVQTRRVRRKTGRSPGVRPRGVKEKALWAGWSAVVVSWLALPFLVGRSAWLPGSEILSSLVNPSSLVLGTSLTVLGYAGTLWCYAAMGDAWRMGILRKETTRLVTHGPYRLVRHPIYLFQVLMMAANAILLPCALFFAILCLHVVCVAIKATDEEAHLAKQLGENYQAYRSISGGWIPRHFGRHAPPKTAPAPAPPSTEHKDSSPTPDP
jgi:protein-S-isoprenylcysteine O-methyltransferase Ste14